MAGVSEIDQRSVSVALGGVTLGIGNTSALHSGGTYDSLIEELTMEANDPDKTCAKSLKIQLGILSGPGVLCTLMLISLFSMFSTLTM